MKTTLLMAVLLTAFSIAAAPAQPAGLGPNGSSPFIPPHRETFKDGPFDLPAPGQKSDFNKILTQATILTEKGLYEDALQHLIWYYTNSETDPGQKGVRCSFALYYWVELGRHYPEATQSLVGIRDGYKQRLLRGNGSSGLFQDVQAINEYLETEDDTYSLFKSIEQRDPKLAGRCYYYVENQLIQRGEYETCRKYIGDPYADFQGIHRDYEQGLLIARHQAELGQKIAAGLKKQQQANELSRQQIQAKYSMYPTGSPPLPLPPLMPDTSGTMKKSVERQFVDEVRALVEILVATDNKSDAEEIQKQALAVLNDPRIESAVDDAYEKLMWQSNAGGAGQSTLPSKQY